LYHPVAVRRALAGFVVVAALAATATRAHAACDVAANASALAAARDAIDDACPCAAALSRGAHVRCAKPVVAARISGGMLANECKSKALEHATKSICGRPGAVVCCRVKTTTGKTAHKITKSPSACASTPTITSCVSDFPSVPTGCDSSGCIAPVCGNGFIDPNESCDPPQTDVCDTTCHTVTCDPPAGSCGNGVVENGEGCEPPGVGACGWDCQTMPCAPPAAGETAVACSADASGSVGVGARSGDYLVAWTDLTYRPHADVVARRLDTEGAPVDAIATVVSAGVECGAHELQPSVGSNAAGYVVAWAGFGPATEAVGATYRATYARSYDGAGTLGSLAELVRGVPIGMCQSSVGGPTSVAPAPLAGATTFAAMWRWSGQCISGPQYVDPDGALVDFGTTPPAKTAMSVGFSPAPPPAVVSASSAAVATLGSASLAVWYAVLVNPSPPAMPFVAGAWLAADGTTSQFQVSSRVASTSSQLRPGIAGGSAAFLVAWANDPSGGTTEIRAMRVAPGGGALDPAGGLVLATTNGGVAVTSGPVVAFDGDVWLVAWTESGTGGNDLRAVAVAADGSVLDVTPRLLASGLGTAGPAIASAGDGRSLVVYVRPDAGRSAVRAQLIPGS
jgi:hypothetical protein